MPNCSTSDEEGLDEETEAVSGFEIEVEMVAERVVEWLQANPQIRPLKKKQLAAEISHCFCRIERIVKPWDVVSQLENRGIIRVLKAMNQIMIDQAMLHEFASSEGMQKKRHKMVLIDDEHIEESKEQMLLRRRRRKAQEGVDVDQEPENVDKRDRDIVLDRVILWMVDNPDVPRQYHSFLHALTQFCEVPYVVDEQEVLQLLEKQGYIQIIKKRRHEKTREEKHSAEKRDENAVEEEAELRRRFWKKEVERMKQEREKEKKEYNFQEEPEEEEDKEASRVVGLLRKYRTKKMKLQEEQQMKHEEEKSVIEDDEDSKEEFQGPVNPEETFEKKEAHLGEPEENEDDDELVYLPLLADKTEAALRQEEEDRKQRARRSLWALFLIVFIFFPIFVSSIRPLP